MIYKRVHEVSTGMSGIEPDLADDKITLCMNTLSVPAKYAGKTLGIHTLGGTQVLSAVIAEQGSTLNLELAAGIYVLQCGDTTLKVKL